MKFFQDCLAAVLAVTDFLTGSTLQHPLQSFPGKAIGQSVSAAGGASDYIIFPPPHIKNPDDPETDSFVCEYPTFREKDWESCSTPTNRSCWLRNKKTGQTFDIFTDYEKVKPQGTTRVYNLTINRANLTLDGVLMPNGVVFQNATGPNDNPNMYPGPWIRGCWGDTIIVNVTNNITEYNGTTIHWHGIRQLNTMQMDGVNGVTQCPVAPGDSFEYKFETWQYGTSWYHSHYSLQYADGLVGPLTIYGPSSANWDEAKKPTLMTDWKHESAFRSYSRINWENKGEAPGPMDSILLNGLGSYGGMSPRRYNVTFEPGKKYLMRLINTAIDTAFVFSIDHHKFEVMSSDFVPIEPYLTDSIVIGIGQRYHVVVHAPTLKELQDNIDGPLEEQNYWIRTIPAKGCAPDFQLGNIPDERQGIVRYDSNSTRIPTTIRGGFSTECADEDASKLVPMVKWTVGEAVNDWRFTDHFQIGISGANGEEPKPLYGEFSHWAIGKQSLWLNFQHPSILNLDKEPEDWDRKAVVIPQNATEADWVYLLISGSHSIDKPEDEARTSIPTRHPMHLHGHDFAILIQSNLTLNETNWQNLTDPSNFNLDNPARRDVVLLPKSGFMVIAFKADNPGVWIMHCHIAFHASSGLALQILERQADIEPLLAKHSGKDWRKPIDHGCAKWDTFYADPHNLWDPKNKTLFQDDSGI